MMPELLRAALAERTHLRLFDAAAECRMAKAVAALPESASRFFGFEVALDRPACGADVLVCTRAAHGERAALAAALDAALPPATAWAVLADFVRAWEDPATPWAASVTNIWTEFDTADPRAPPAPPPSLFFGLRADAASMLPGPLAVLLGGAVPPSVATTVGRCLAAAAAAGARPFQVGVMLGRGSGQDVPVRLCLRGAAPDGIDRVLRTCGHPLAGAAALEPLLVAHGPPRAAGVDLGIDVLPDGTLGPRIGLELPPPADVAGLLGKLAALVRAGIADQARVDALVAAFGVTHERRHRAIWPAGLAALARAQGPNVHGMVMRRLNHVKLTLAPGAAPTLKAYLAAEVVLMEDAALKTLITQAAI